MMDNSNSLERQLQNLKDMRKFLLASHRYSDKCERAYLILLEQLCTEWTIIQWRKMQEEYSLANLELN